jgi:hypothetical protein
MFRTCDEGFVSPNSDDEEVLVQTPEISRTETASLEKARTEIAAQVAANGDEIPVGFCIFASVLDFLRSPCNLKGYLLSLGPFSHFLAERCVCQNMGVWSPQCLDAC